MSEMVRQVGVTFLVLTGISIVGAGLAWLWRKVTG